MAEQLPENTFSYSNLKHPLPSFPIFAFSVQDLVGHYGNTNWGATSSYDIGASYDGRMLYGNRYKVGEIGLHGFSVEAVYRAMDNKPAYDYAALHVYTYAGSQIIRRRSYTQLTDFSVLFSDKSDFKNPVPNPVERLSDDRLKHLLDVMLELSRRRPDESLLQMLGD